MPETFLIKKLIVSESELPIEEYIQNMILTNESQQSVLFLLIFNFRITSIIQAIQFSLLIYQRVNSHQIQHPLSNIPIYRIFISHIVGLMYLIIGIVMFLIIDIELERYQVEIKVKDIKVMKVIHDLKNPILSLKNMIDQNEIDQKDSYLTELGDMEEMLDNLRTEFKFKNQMKFSEAATLIKTRDLIQSMMHTHSYLAKAQKNQVNYSIQTNFPSQIILESSVVKRILNNFISNALKHTKNGKVFINFQTEQYQYIKENQNDVTIGDVEKCKQNHSNKYDLTPDLIENNKPNSIKFIVIEVSDNGVGIPEEILNEVFDEKVTDQNEANWEGTGMGLPICKYLTNQINGFIRYNSLKSQLNRQSNLAQNAIYPDNQLKNSTYFKLYLPLRPGQVNEGLNSQSIEQDQRIQIDSQIQNNHKCNSIILVEDNTSIVKIYERLFNYEKIDQITFSSGQYCLDYIHNLKSHNCLCSKLTILTDFVMPGISGHEMALRIRTMNLNLSVQIVLATAESSLCPDKTVFDEVWEKPVKNIQLKILQEKSKE